MGAEGVLEFTGERIVPNAENCEPLFAKKMYQEHVARYLFAAQLSVGKTVLDVGCGVGYGSQILGQMGAKSVAAFDLSDDAIRHAKKEYGHPNVRFYVDNAEDFHVDEKVDVVVCFELIEHVERQRQVFQRIKRALKPNGVVVMSTPRALPEKRTHFHTHEFSLGEFEGLFLDFFADVKMYYENNHFTSLVTDHKPVVLDMIYSLNEQFSLAQADYFIAVGKMSTDTQLPVLKPVMTLNDDAYVNLQERDVAILHRAEDDHKNRIAALEQQLKAEREQVERLETDRAQAEHEQAGQLQSAQAQAAQLEAEKSALEKLQEEQAGQLQSAQAQAAQLEAEKSALEKLQEEQAGQLKSAQAQAEQLAAEKSALEKLREEQVEQLKVEQAKAARAQADLAAVQSHWQEVAIRAQETARQLETRIAEHLARLDGAAYELAEARRSEASTARLLSEEQQRVTTLHGVIKEIRQSTSWKITAPVRGLSRLVGSPGHVVRVMRHYRSVHGTRGLIGAVGRKLTGRPVEPGKPASVAYEPPPEPARRAPEPPAEGTGPQYDVIMLIGCWEGESKRYRVHNVAEALSADGARVLVHPFSDLRDILNQRMKARTIVFFRSPYEDGVGTTELIEYARRNNIRIVFDIDDLVFDPSIVDNIHGVKHLGASEKEQYIDGVIKYRQLLLAADLVTVTTDPLARAVEALGKPCAIIPNSINRAQCDAADLLLAGARLSDGRLLVGYFSGSRTHERDFAQAEPALLRLMAERDDWDLLVVGFLEMGPAWQPYAHRIRRQGFLPYLDMLKVLSECDINIAPLEVGDMFCEAKSELKYFEAALVGVPTVASATEPFAKAIRDGETSFLARTDEDWYSALSRLMADEALRRQIGEAGRIAALDMFGVEATCRSARAALLDGQTREQAQPSAPVAAVAVPSAPSAEASARISQVSSARKKLKIDWIIPGLIIGGGGHRNILRAAHHLQSFGHDVGLHITNTDKSGAVLRDVIHKHFYPFQGQVKPYDGVFRQSDAIMATHWTTVDAALRAKGQTRDIMYFVQDFEPAFAPMGSEYVLAENTYRLGLYCITSGPWCEVMLKRDFNAQADHFRFPVDTSVYKERPRTKTNKNIIFFAKPEMPRRCFEIGAMALAHVHRARPDLEIKLFGSSKAKEQHVDFPATYLDIVPTIHDLSEMYANADLGIVFSTTNPSLVPYEMMASGCPVVDLNRPGNEVNYDGRRDIAYLADPIPENMAMEIVSLLDDPAQLARRRKNGLDFAATFPSEEEMARRVEELIVNRIASLG